jgi:hypothetical protein
MKKVTKHVKKSFYIVYYTDIEFSCSFFLKGKCFYGVLNNTLTTNTVATGPEGPAETRH